MNIYKIMDGKSSDYFENCKRLRNYFFVFGIFFCIRII